MKKVLKLATLFLIMAGAIVLLTGCGGDKLVATKATEDSILGNYEEKITVTFKDDIVDKVEMAMEFESEEKAQSMYGFYQLGVSMSEDDSLEGLDVEQNGKKLVISMDAEAYAASEGEDLETEEMTKDAIRASLEESGYEVK